MSPCRSSSCFRGGIIDFLLLENTSASTVNHIPVPQCSLVSVGLQTISSTFVLLLFQSLVLYECCPGYMKLEGMRGCPAGRWQHFTIPCFHYDWMCIPTSPAVPPVAPIDHVYGTLGLLHATSTQQYSQMAGMREELEGRGSFTMFAPSDDAWAQLDPVSIPGPMQPRRRSTGTLTLAVSSGRARFSGEQRERGAEERSSLPHGEPPSAHQRPEERRRRLVHVQ